MSHPYAMGLHAVEAGALRVTYLERGPENGVPVVLLHGFPYDVAAYDQISARLEARDFRTITPFLRGFGPTRFLDDGTPRSGQQAALGDDLRALLDALDISSAVLAGYDWGGRAACVVAALWPERVRGLVSVDGYAIQNIAASAQPHAPENERRLWYQYYFHGERGRAGLTQRRRELCKLLWQTWSPSWTFDDATFERSAASFDNPDFVDVVCHSYRHRFGLIAGDPALEPLERQLAALPDIRVPAITLDGADDGVSPLGGSAHHRTKFAAHHEHRVLRGIGHNLPQEAPAEFAQAVVDVERAA